MIKKNIIANILVKIWSIFAIYIFTPLYLKLLGVEAFGLVSFYATLLGLLVFADLGISATINREIALYHKDQNAKQKTLNLIKTLETIYWIIGALICLFFFLYSNSIATYWLKNASIPKEHIAQVVNVMGVAIAIQLISGLYNSGLMGLEKQVKANVIEFIWGLVRGLGCLLLLLFVSKDPLIFVIWQLVSNGLYFFMSRFILLREIRATDRSIKPRFELKLIRNLSSFAGGMVVLAILSAFIQQADKIFVSKNYTLEIFGYYVLAWTLASVPITIARPVVMALFPRFAKLIKDGGVDLLKIYYRNGYELIGLLVGPFAIISMVYSKDIIHMWTFSTEASDNAYQSATFLIGAQLLQAITLAPYYLALAAGNVSTNVKVGLVSLPILISSIFYFSSLYGLSGVAFSWLLTNLLVLFPYMYSLHKRIFIQEFGRWVNFGFIIPFLPTIILTIIAVKYFNMPNDWFGKVVFLIVLYLIAFFFTLNFLPNVKAQFKKVIRQIGLYRF